MKRTRIKFIKNTAGIGYGYMAGQQHEFSEAFADEMIELGVAVKSERQTELPTDFPGYKPLTENGFRTLSEIKKIATVDQLVEIKGIGEKLALQIIDRLKK